MSLPSAMSVLRRTIVLEVFVGRRARSVALLPLVVCCWSVSSARGAPTSEPPPALLAGGVLTIEREAAELHVDADGAVLSWPEGERRFSARALRGLSAIRAAGGLRVTGELEREGPLALSARTLRVAGRLSAEGLTLRAEAALELEDAGRLEARGGAVELEADRLLLVGEVEAADGGEVRARARFVLHAGPVHTAGGRVQVDCERFVGTTSGAIVTADPTGEGGWIRVLASTRLFTSGRYEATGERGGRVLLSGPEVRLAAATVDASGQQQGGTVRVGAGLRLGPPPRGSARRWHAEEVVIGAYTALRADGLRGSGGTVVVGANDSTRFAGGVRARGLGGRGGEVELSAGGTLRYDGRIAADGLTQDGRVLLDPQDLILDDASPALAQYELFDEHPGSGSYGEHLEVLPNGNVVVVDPLDDSLFVTDGGAVYLFDGTTGALISALYGDAADDQIGSSGVLVLTNGNFVVLSPDADRPFGAGDVGAATWVDGAVGRSGSVNLFNSLFGDTTNDAVGAVAVALTNGNYVVVSPDWSFRRGAVTWVDGQTGLVGTVSSANSLVGSTADDQIGYVRAVALLLVVPLENGNYVVASPLWDDGATMDAGAATWCDGAVGRTGTITSTNSLVGGAAGDGVGSDLVALTNGNYVVVSPAWNDGSADVGAVTWGDGSSGVTGGISSSNSLVGAQALDFSSVFVTPLSNGHYVVDSNLWNGGDGCVAWCDGTGGTVGVVSASNALVGQTGDRLASDGVTALTNGNYVIASRLANGNRGVVTWVDGSSGGTTNRTGVIDYSGSLVGRVTTDFVGSEGVVALTNGNYAFASPLWDDFFADMGAVTWADGTQVTSGQVSDTNSMIGALAGEQVGSGGVFALTNGHYVFSSPHRGNVATDGGAVTWADGTQASTGLVNGNNSLIGGSNGDQVGQTVLPLQNGNYVVASPLWDDGGVADVGAVTWGDGTGGTVGLVDATNSLLGSTALDSVGNGGLTDLENGSVAVRSGLWGSSDEGAFTLISASGPTAEAVGAANSLLGTGASASAGWVRALGDGMVVSFVDHRVLVGLRLGGSTYDLASGQTITATTERIVELLSAGTDVTLQASRDLVISSPLVVANPSGAGGHLTLAAGRSVLIQAPVTTDDGDLTVIANDLLANGVVDADRSAGAAQVLNTSLIDAGAGAVRFETRDGTGLTNRTRADYEVGTITAGSTTVVPFVDVLTPTSAEIGVTQVTLQGGGLSGATVTVGGVAASMTSVASDEVTFTLAAGTPTGTQPVVLTTSSGSVAVGNLQVDPLADLAVAKTVDDATPAEGATITYTITLTNNGPDDSSSVELTDSLPAGVTFVSATASQGSFDPGTGLWSVGTLAATASGTLELTCTVDLGTGGTTITNTTSGLAGTNLGGSTADDVGSVSIVPRLCDLAVTKTVDQAAPEEGATVVYTITVLNQGPSDADAIQLFDALPTGVTLVSAAPSQGVFTGGVWTVGDLVDGAAATLELTCTVDAGTGGTTITNTTSGLTAIGLGGSSADDVGSVAIVPLLCDLAVSLSVDRATPLMGETVVYTVTVTNNGPSAADGVGLTAAVPSGVTLVTATPSQGTYDAGSGLWEVGNLANAADATLLLECTVDAGTGGSTITTTTSGLTATAIGGSTADDVGSVAIVPRLADLAVSKSADPPNPRAGKEVTFTTTVTNNGPTAADAIQLTDALPSGLTFVRASASQGSYDSGSGVWSVGTLADGASATLTLVATPDAGTNGLTLTSTASGLTADGLGGNAADNVASVSVDVVRAGGSSGCALSASTSAGGAPPLALLALLLAAFVGRVRAGRLKTGGA